MPNAQFKKLSSPSGHVTDSVGEGSENEIQKNAILVHGGPNGEKVTFMSGDGEISFDDDRIKRIVDNHNSMIEKLAAQYGGIDKMPHGAFPPILDAHENDSNNRIVGRLASLLKFEKRNVPGVGENVACATALITFKGKDTVDRVKDGRIYHLSIGIDETSDTLGETSTVIEPAAPGAMLLSTGKDGKTKLQTKGEKMPKQPVKDKKRLQRHAERMAKLSAINENLTALTKTNEGTKELIRLTGRKREITHRLSKLMSEMKMTPAEFKKLDLTRLSKMAPEDADVFLNAYEVRPKYETKQAGSTEAIEFSDIGKNLEKRQMKRLKAEIKGDLKKLGANIKGDDKAEDKDHGDAHEMGGGNELDPVSTGKDPHAVADEMPDKVMSHLKACLEAGDIEGAKKAHEALSKHMSGGKELSGAVPGDVKSEDDQKSLDAMQSQLDEVHTNMARLAGMVSELMESEKDEGHDLEAGGEEPADGKEGQDGKNKPGDAA
jgi:hypothetical protein